MRVACGAERRVVVVVLAGDVQSKLEARTSRAYEGAGQVDGFSRSSRSILAFSLRLVPPGELDDGEREVARVGREESRGTDVPGDGGRGDTDSTSSLGDLGGASLVAYKVADEEEQEGEVQEEEEDDQADRGAERGDEHDEGEDLVRVRGWLEGESASTSSRWLRPAHILTNQALR